MCGQKSGLVGRIQEKMREEALQMEHVMSSIKGVVNFIRAKGLNHRQFKSFLEDSEYRDVPYHTEVTWRSRGKVLNRCFELREEICKFMENKGKDTTELRDEKLLRELPFLSDIVSHLDVLSLQLQARGHVITDMHAAVRAFKTKLRLWKTQMLQGNFGHFPCCQTTAAQISPAVLPRAQFAEKIYALSAELPTSRLRKGDLNCSVTRLRPMWKAHQPASKWS